jgi:hypothetical protein
LRAPDVAEYELWLGFDTEKRQIMARRRFKFEGLVFPSSSYGEIKRLFDAVHERDGHLLALKLSPATPPAGE